MDERREKAVIRPNHGAPAAASRLAPLVLGAVLAAGPARAAVFVVDSVGDQAAQPPTSNGICNSTAGTCTLRAAIQEANGSGGADTIQFSIGSGGVTISPASVLPTITTVVTIDGTTQPGYAGTPIIELNGAAAGSPNGLTVNGGSGSTIKALVLGRFNNAIRLLASTSGNIVIGNYIGTDKAGTAANANVVGVFIQNSGNNRVGGTAAGDLNLISGNSNDGIQITGASATGNDIQGNYIGLAANGTAPLGNGAQGVAIFGTANNNTVGGTAGGARNVISGNGNLGIGIGEGGTTGNLIQGNRIGTNATGTASVPNFHGVGVSDTDSVNTIGGAAAGRNLISGNTNSGILFSNALLTTVSFNNIGIDATDVVALPNGQHGIQMLNGSSNNTIGGNSSALNVISGNGLSGIEMNGGSGNVIAGNTIGRDPTNTLMIPNGAHGIRIISSSNNTIGGTVANQANIIAGSGTGDGVSLVGAALGNAILGNSIFGNFGRAIDHGDDGVTFNDLGDGDGGPNNTQNFPVLSGVTTDGVGNVHIAGSLNTDGLGATYRVEFYAGSVPDGPGHGEGDRYLGSTNMTTDVTGNGVIAATLPVLVTPGEFVSATATDASNNTSEFAANITAVGDIVVTTTADNVDGNTTSVANLIANNGADGRISLREAIQATNNTAGTDTIRFGIPLADAGHYYYSDDGVAGLSTVATTPVADADIGNFDPDYPLGTPFSWFRIQTGSTLPTISGPVVLDAYTQPGAQANSVAAPGLSDAILKVELRRGAGAGNGLNLTAGNSEIYGLVINAFTAVGVNVSSGGNNVLAGNYVGTDVTGTIAVANSSRGMEIWSANNTIGGTTSAARNLLSGNDSVGVQLRNAGAIGNLVAGNYIGTDVTGTLDLGNFEEGVRLAGGPSNNTIGGTSAGARNVISGNKNQGITFWAPAVDTVIQGNYIGTDASGTAAVPNGTLPATPWGGIGLGGTNTTVGGTAPGAGNLISGNLGAGIEVWDSGHTIQGNFIGTDASGTAPLPNTTSGLILYAVSNTTIGGTAAGAANTIAFNSDRGVLLEATAGTGNVILGNSIHSNGSLGIDLNDDGVTLNDSGDVDAGPNGLLNFPQMPPPIETAGTISADFGLDVAAGFYRVEFFKNPSGADPSGYGEGELPVPSSVVVQHLGTGLEAFNHTFAGSAGDIITATTTLCTDVTILCSAPGSTSEFSFALAAVTTVAELVSFTAAGEDEAVFLEWRTASELNNLGFHVHRSLSERGPWTRVTPSLIPGLGSSPEGASYSFRDTGLTNGVRYFYRLEDIDAYSGSTFHGPVSAVPEASADEEEDPADSGEDPKDPETRTYGRPEDATFRVVSRSKHAVVVELSTPGFVTTETPFGVRVSVPAFDQRTDPRAPDLPLKRVVLDAVVGRHARILWVKERRTQSFTGLTPAAVGAAEIVSSPDGTVRPGRRPATLKGEGLLPPLAARIAGDAFIGETKKLALEMSPLRYDAASQELRLSQTLRVKIAFDRKAAREETGRGSHGRRRPRSVEDAVSEVLAHLHTRTGGLHAVSFETLCPQGHEAVPLDSLRLRRQGKGVPFHVEPRRKPFGPGSVLFFYAPAEARSTDYSPEVAYALERSPGGVPMPSVSASPRGAKPLSSASLAEASFETNRYYQAGLLDAPDIWLWDFLVGEMSKSFPLVVDGVDPTSALAVHLQVLLQGASEADTEAEHHLSVSLNGTPLGETSFDGKLPHVFSTSVAASVLQEGENTLIVTNLGDTGAYSFVFLDRVDLVYPQTPALRSGVFEGVFSEAGEAVVTGEASVGLDVTDPEAPVWLQGLRPRSGTVSFRAEASHRYVLASPEGLLSPRVSLPVGTTLRSHETRAEYILIAPEAFLEAARPLLERRRDQGLTAKAVSFEEIASEFGHGRASAQAIRDFLAYAYHSWTEPSVRYVLLLGDASYDPRNFTGFDQGAPLPALWAKTSYLWTASDPTLGAVNGEDLLPDVAIGRLPAKTLEQARALVEKVLAWEDSAQDLSGTAVLVADNPDLAGDFEADLLDIQASFLASRSTKTLFLRQLGRSMRSEILASFDAGASLMSYVGHGGPAVWASENVLNSWDPPKLLAQPRQPLMLTFNCLNGYFVAPNYEALSEAFLKVEGRGTIGAFSPSGLSLDAPAHLFHRALMAEITGGTHARLGDAVLAAQAAYAEEGVMPELLAIYHLLADPGLTIR